ncbi:endonuclease/exonuclease/phosphatase family protein [Jiella flava]|uniref:Endonuclease/exonuclease/phosphatase family protein n=1 Tax=Jiella flava TaxID=2816857 RepID=A0A939G1N0_9HYPH|nr:endonuclease/exonuclease/phosphatase family protein [Jiella flava]MBO0664210.1 endonuclease/exonuclease/phosphatase family protein [Jiella flava]
MIFASYNIQYGLGQDGRYDLERIAAAVAGADVIALQEVDRFWQRSGMVDGPAVIADALPEHHWVYAPNLDMDASYRNDAGRLINRRRQFGCMILSRAPILSSRNFPLPKRGTLTQHSIQQGLLEAVIATERGPLRVYCAHLSHLCPETRLPQIEAMLDIFARAPAEGGAWCGGHPNPAAGWTEGAVPPMPREMILMGDMNFTAVSAEYAQLVGPMAGKHGRLANPEGLVDAWVAAGHGEGEGATHANAGRIDHCFISASLSSGVREMRVDTSAQGSDHFPIFLEISA